MCVTNVHASKIVGTGATEAFVLNYFPEILVHLVHSQTRLDETGQMSFHS